MQKYFKWMKYLDISSGVGCILYALWLLLHSGLSRPLWPLLWALGGILGIILGILRPAEKLALAASKKLSGQPVSIKKGSGFPSPPSSSYRPPV